MTLELMSPRLRLSPLTAQDAPAFYAYRRLPSVTQFQNFEPQSLEDAQAFLANARVPDPSELHVWCQLGIRLRETDVLVGDVGFVLEPDQHAQIGCTIAPAHQRRGYATEALQALFEHLFSTLSLHRVTASADPDNASSRAMLTRLGMRQEAHHRRSYRFKGRWVDDVIYALLAEEWAGA